MNLFSLDIDWAPEEVIEDSLALFDEYGINCTVFCTHKSGVIDNIRNAKNYEIGIHPNFMPLMTEAKGNVNETIKNLLDIFPEAKGVRSHSLVHSSRIDIIYKDFGFNYHSSTFLPYWSKIYPYKLWNELVCVPFNFIEDIHYRYGKDYANCEIDLRNNPLNVITFHPVNIFLNTDSLDTYTRASKYYHEPKELLRFRNTKVKGTRDLLVDMLKQHKAIFSNESYTIAQYLNKIEW
jgi:hypothetical protein